MTPAIGALLLLAGWPLLCLGPAPTSAKRAVAFECTARQEAEDRKAIAAKDYRYSQVATPKTSARTATQHTNTAAHRDGQATRRLTIIKDKENI